MKVYVYPGDKWGCGGYRMMWPAQAINRAGLDLDVEVVPPSDRQISMEVNQSGRVVRERFPDDADVIVFQRPTSGYVGQAIQLLQQRGVAVVADMDDDLAHIDPANPAWMQHQPTVRAPDGSKVPNAHNHTNAALSCKVADLVTVSTPQLLDTYAGHGRGALLRNCVPARYLDVEHADSDLIGWGGSLASHPNDLQVMGGAIAQLVREGAVFETAGDPEGVGRLLSLDADPGGPGIVPLHDWPTALARFGIGLAPLGDTRFNRAKSWLKPLEYSAVGVPWVASPRPEYEAWLRVSGGGQLADKPKHWTSVLRRLWQSPEMRADMGATGREAAANHTIEGNAWRWAEAWASAHASHRARHIPVGT